MAFNEESWDKEELRKLYSSDTGMHALLDDLAKRGRKPNNSTTNVDDLLQFGLGRGHAVRLLRKLDEYRCGRFIVGRRDKKSRFEWKFSAIEVAKDAQQAELAPTQSTSDTTSKGEVDNWLEQNIIVRAGVMALLRIPANLTQREAKKLAAIVENLWLVPDAS